MSKTTKKGANRPPKKFTLIEGMTSEEYHGTAGTFSSSQLKDILEDEELFYRKHIAKTEEKKHINAFDVGTYFHTAMLEPHLLKQECAVYDGFRRGESWRKFQEKNKGKAIITRVEKASVDKLIKMAKDNKILMKRVKKGTPEVSAFIDVIVRPEEGLIFCLSPRSSYILKRDGWAKCDYYDEDDDVTLTLKARADSLLLDYGEIFDLKTTTGNTKKLNQIRATVRKHNYDLSGALYLDIFSMASGYKLSKFTWGFASKDYMNCCVWKMDEAYVRVGRAKWKKAVVEIARGIRDNWDVVDTVRSIGPSLDELDLLSELEP